MFLIDRVSLGNLRLNRF